MISKVGELLYDDGLSKSELIDKLEIGYTSYCDAFELVELMTKSFGVSNKCFAIEQLIRTRVDLNRSVKIYNPSNNRIYGFLLISDFHINDGSPIKMVKPYISEFITSFKMIHGFAFFLDKRLRGSGLDKKMIEMITPYIESFEFTWIAVDNDLKSHNYWKRLGFHKIFDIPEAVFYGKFGKNIEKSDIYYKMIFDEQIW